MSTYSVGARLVVSPLRLVLMSWLGALSVPAFGEQYLVLTPGGKLVIDYYGDLSAVALASAAPNVGSRPFGLDPGGFNDFSEWPTVAEGRGLFIEGDLVAALWFAALAIAIAGNVADPLRNSVDPRDDLDDASGRARLGPAPQRRGSRWRLGRESSGRG